MENIVSQTLSLHSDSFQNGAPIPGEFALCVPDPDTIITLAANRNPQLRWSGIPQGTQSLTLLMLDPDAPSIPDQVNKEGETVPHDLPRIDFYHWVLVDISPDIREIPAGADSDGVTTHGKPIGSTAFGMRGRNDYTAWFQGDTDMEGTYGGYDGPCPPWNDERLHHYLFRLHALDIPTLKLAGDFGGSDALAAMQGHILDQADWMGLYTFRPKLYD